MSRHKYNYTKVLKMSTQGINTTQLSLISSIHANQKKEAYIYNPSMLAITKTITSNNKCLSDQANFSSFPFLKFKL